MEAWLAGAQWRWTNVAHLGDTTLAPCLRSIVLVLVLEGNNGYQKDGINTITRNWMSINSSFSSLLELRFSPSTGGREGIARYMIEDEDEIGSNCDGKKSPGIGKELLRHDN